MSKVVCAWCGKFIRRLDDRRTGTSHGICTECWQKHFPEFSPQAR